MLAFPLLTTGCSSCEKTNTNSSAPTVDTSAASVSGGGVDPECAKLCPINGRCKVKDGKCFANTDQDCANCAGCKAFGLCAVKNGSCAALTEEHCTKSAGCSTNGKCTVKDGQCIKAE